jgi:PAS domain-containing protein
MRKGVTQHWRQVNLMSGEGDIPVRFVTVSLGATGCLAIGRDMRDEAALQQRMLQAQQSLERDYIRLRQLEARYRLLFEQTVEPVLIVDADSFRIREASRGAPGVPQPRRCAAAGRQADGVFANPVREQVIAFLGSAMVSQGLAPLTLRWRKVVRRSAFPPTAFASGAGNSCWCACCRRQMPDGPMPG